MMGHERIDLDSGRRSLLISGRVMNEFCAHARETQPEECCGLITGDFEQRFRTVRRCRNEMTQLHLQDPERYPRDGKKAFYMNPTDYLKAMQEAEGRGETVNAVYHSHVGAGAYFSEMDQEFAEAEAFPFPDVAHIVIAMFDGQVNQLGVFERSANGAPFTGRILEAEPA
ncbi:MAG: M67 family metallopeptidase [bacterium]|nr:M67 family metallopeptidase [bacterium]